MSLSRSPSGLDGLLGDEISPAGAAAPAPVSRSLSVEQLSAMFSGAAPTPPGGLPALRSASRPTSRPPSRPASVAGDLPPPPPSAWGSYVPSRGGAGDSPGPGRSRSNSVSSVPPSPLGSSSSLDGSQPASPARRSRSQSLSGSLPSLVPTEEDTALPPRPPGAIGAPSAIGPSPVPPPRPDRLRAGNLSSSSSSSLSGPSEGFGAPPVPDPALKPLSRANSISLAGSAGVTSADQRRSSLPPLPGTASAAAAATATAVMADPSTTAYSADSTPLGSPALMSTSSSGGQASGGPSTPSPTPPPASLKPGARTRSQLSLAQSLGESGRSASLNSLNGGPDAKSTHDGASPSPGDSGSSPTGRIDAATAAAAAAAISRRSSSGSPGLSIQTAPAPASAPAPPLSGGPRSWADIFRSDPASMNSSPVPSPTVQRPASGASIAAVPTSLAPAAQDSPSLLASSSSGSLRMAEPLMTGDRPSPPLPGLAATPIATSAAPVAASTPAAATPVTPAAPAVPSTRPSTVPPPPPTPTVDGPKFRDVFLAALRAGDSVMLHAILQRRAAVMADVESQLSHLSDSQSDMPQVEYLNNRLMNYSIEFPIGPFKWPPLHLAVRAGRIDLCQSLIEFGADVGSLDALGQTPLHHAVMHGHRQIGELLLQKRADPTARDIFTHNAADVCVFSRRIREGDFPAQLNKTIAQTEKRRLSEARKQSAKNKKLEKRERELRAAAASASPSSPSPGSIATSSSSSSLAPSAMHPGDYSPGGGDHPHAGPMSSSPISAGGGQSPVSASSSPAPGSSLSRRSSMAASAASRFGLGSGSGSGSGGSLGGASGRSYLHQAMMESQAAEAASGMAGPGGWSEDASHSTPPPGGQPNVPVYGAKHSHPSSYAAAIVDSNGPPPGASLSRRGSVALRNAFFRGGT